MDEFIQFTKDNSIDQTQLDMFVTEHNKEQMEQAEAQKLQNKMLETLNKDIG